jgi:hypothetical protein
MSSRFESKQPETIDLEDDQINSNPPVEFKIKTQYNLSDPSFELAE